MTEHNTAGEFERPPFETVHEKELASAAAHLESSRKLSKEAHDGWTHLPKINENDDAHHPGFAEKKVPTDPR